MLKQDVGSIFKKGFEDACTPLLTHCVDNAYQDTFL